MKEKAVEQYIAEARSFDQDRMLASRRTTRVSLAIAGICRCCCNNVLTGGHHPYAP